MKTYTTSCLSEARRPPNSHALESSRAHTERYLMTAVSDREAEEPALRCPQCGSAGEFGYRDVYGAMRWFCARHRLRPVFQQLPPTTGGCYPMIMTTKKLIALFTTKGQEVFNTPPMACRGIAPVPMWIVPD